MRGGSGGNQEMLCVGHLSSCSLHMLICSYNMLKGGVAGSVVCKQHKLCHKLEKREVNFVILLGKNVSCTYAVD